ncbi:MAG: 30S ribosomal protein S4 [Patescibacteria group bacterium]
MLKACKKCRREGEKLLLKGERCLSAKCSVVRRSYAPGEHGQGFRSKMSEYGRQLREKQKARRMYGISESQFRNYAKKSSEMAGDSIENLLILLESRLDNVVFRMGYASSRSESRQYVSHGLFTVNGHKVTIASYQVKPGSIISPKKPEKFQEVDLNKSLSWVEMDQKKVSGEVLHLPTKDEIDTQVNASLIIEFYSR